MTGFYSKHPIISHVVLIIMSGVFLALLALLFLDIWTEHGKTSTVPDIKGVPYSQAILLLDEAGMEIEISDSVYDSSARPGTVMESWPRALTTVKPGRKVFVTVNAFSPRKITVSMPIKDISYRQAVAYLEGLGLTSIRTDYVTGEFDDLVKGAYVGGKQIEPGMTLPVNATVTVVVTKAPSEASADSTYDDFTNPVLTGDDSSNGE